MNVSHFVKICQVLTIFICRGVANFGTRCTIQWMQWQETTAPYLDQTTFERRQQEHFPADHLNTITTASHFYVGQVEFLLTRTQNTTRDVINMITNSRQNYSPNYNRFMKHSIYAKIKFYSLTYNYLHRRKRLCFWFGLFVCLSVCLSVRRITHKLVNGFWRNFLEG